MTGRTRIKICGMTRHDDAEAAVGAGVDALGFIFADQSPRKIDPELASEIIGKLPPFVDAIGVFVNQDPLLVEEIIQYCGLTMVQLHGDEPPLYCENFTGRVIKAIRVDSELDDTIFTSYAGLVKGFLLDTYQPGVAGGTGRVFDWSLAADAVLPAPMILAGGLSPDNVAAAVRQVRPFAVDLNSGVEFEPGRKDINRILQAVTAVSLADQAIRTK